MKLKELNLNNYKHISKNKWNMPDNLFKWLKENNFKLIGEGVFSDAYESDEIMKDKFIVKVNRGELDKRYLEFVDFCQENKQNTHLPKMGNIRMFEGWYIIFIEKLKPIKTDFLGFNFEKFYTFFNKLVDFGMQQNLQKISLEKEIKDFFILNSKKPDLIELYLEQFCEMSIILGKLKEKLNCNTLDLHDGNIMLRGNTLVIIDP